MQRLNISTRTLAAWLATLTLAVGCTALIVIFGFQIVWLEGQSMEPTLSNQDLLVVNMLAYRLGEPHRGDIVLFHHPTHPQILVVKRVIAEEGDRVRIVNGRFYLNDVAMSDTFTSLECRNHDHYGPIVVPAGHYFMMGDHRHDSLDSRHWGAVPEKYIIGRVQLRWWPILQARIF